MTDAVTGRDRLATARRFIEIGRPEHALEALSGLDPAVAASGEAMWLRGAAHLGLEDNDRAADAAREGLVDEPDDADLLYLLSIAEKQREDLAAAEHAILAALALEPASPELLAQYADVLLRAGQLDKAERVLGHAAKAGPDSAPVLQTRIMLAHLRHDDRRAEQLTHELLARDPESLSGQTLLGGFEWQRGDARRASQRFAEVVRADPADSQVAGWARTTRRMSNPLWWPMRFVTRYGAARTWVAAVATIFGLRAVGLDTAALVATGIWVVICVLSWIGVAVLRER